ncbi:MAG: hypothetical protein H6737_18855 [Alphaproteobacteria bacterium]|nr:hypothetical protein [Alphaproteobacteria bacterium]
MWATWRQQVLVSWAARLETANLQIEARNAFFAGQNSFGDAFPGLAGARLDRPSVVRGRLVALQDRATARESERQEPIPELGSDERRAEATAARSAALEAEERADGLVRRLLTGIAAHLDRNPGLRDEGLARLRKPLQDELEAVRAPVDDPVQQAARDARAAAADGDLAALDQLQFDLMLHAVADRPVPSPDPMLPLLAETDRGEAAAQRLRLLLPWLEPAAAARVEAALAEYSRGPALEKARAEREAAAEAARLAATAPILRSVEVLSSARAGAQAGLDALETKLAGLPEGDPDRERIGLERDAQADRVKELTVRLERAQGIHDGKLDAATAAADRARKQAEEAAATAADDRERARAKFLGEAADARDRVREAAKLLEDRRSAIAADAAARDKQVEGFQEQLVAIEKSSPLPGSGPDADEVYRDLRKWRKELIDGEIARGYGVQTADEKVAEVTVHATRERQIIASANQLGRDAAIEAASEDWEAALDEELAIAEELGTVARDERQAVLTSLQQIAELRRELRGYVSWTEREKDRRELGADVARELRLLVPTVLARMSNRAQELLELPYRFVRDATLLIDAAWGLFWLVVLLGSWRWARDKSMDIASRAAVQVKRLKPDLRPIDAQRLKGPTSDAVKALIDLSLGYLMVSFISPLSPEIAFVVETWLLLAIYRVMLAAFDLAVVRAPEFRPSLIALAAKTYDLLRFTTRVLIIWGIARGFTYYVLWSTLQLDTVAGLAMTMFNLVFVFLVAWLLYQWDPILRDRVRARNQESQIVAFLSREVPRPLRPLSALAMLTFFGITLGVDLLYFFLARDRTGLARVFNVITRYQMGATEDQSLVPIPQETMDALCSREPGHPVYVTRPGLDEELDAVFQGWKKDSRRGMVALVGDRGEGKRTEIARFLARLDGGDIHPYRCRLNHAMLSEHELLAWLAEVTGVAPAETADKLVENLRQAPRAVFVVEQAHRAYSRSVGGFAAITQLLYVLNATSDHHFWLVSFHRPGWRYLGAIPSIVDVGVFRSVINLEPFDASMLRDLTQKRAKAAGLDLDYRGLMRANLLGADPEVEQERATNAFFRLLSEASEGNPRVAMHLFAACLEPGDRTGKARVLTRKALRTEVASDLSVDALFTLTALRQQDAMELAEIVEVTNLPLHTVRNTVRDLQSRGLVEGAKTLIYIPIENLPLVSRTLRRRHLLYLGA